MPQDRDEKPGPAAKVAPRFDFDDLPRVRPVFILTPEERGAQPAPQKPATAPSNETSFERDPENVPTGATQVSRQDRRAGDEAIRAEIRTGAITPENTGRRLASAYARQARERIPSPSGGADPRERGRTSRVPRHRRG